MFTSHIKFPLIVFFFSLAAGIAPVRAEEGEDASTLRMFYEESDLIPSVVRNPVSVSRTAENITIVTADEIETLNAHTLADVLMNVPGVEIELRGGPGTVTAPSIHGSNFSHVLFLIDGVALNNISDLFPDAAAIPVQNIERVEVLKGPASSSWGSALGGVVNVVTKDPITGRKSSGALSSSVGEKNTGDYRGEFSGTVGKLGYYFSGGRFTSDGLAPNNQVFQSNFYSKLKMGFSEGTTATFTSGYINGYRQEDVPPEDDVHTYFFSTLSLSHAVNDELTFDASTRLTLRDTLQHQPKMATIVRGSAIDESIGGSAKLLWRHGIHNAAFGVDYDHGNMDVDLTAVGGTGLLKLNTAIDKWGLFASDSLVFDRFSITPGIRYDRTNTTGSAVSPSLGLTYDITGKTVARFYIGKGFSLPTTFPGMDNERIWSLHVGIETSELKYLVLKTTFFRDETWTSHLSNLSDITVTRNLRQGVETSLKTAACFNTRLTGGFTFVDARDLSAGSAEISGVPRYTWKIGILYNDGEALRTSLTGYYTWWNAPSQFKGRYNDFIWDYNISRKFTATGGVTPEVFFTLHNILDGKQYPYGFAPNPGRWAEGGMRFHF